MAPNALPMRVIKIKYTAVYLCWDHDKLTIGTETAFICMRVRHFNIFLYLGTEPYAHEDLLFIFTENRRFD